MSEIDEIYMVYCNVTSGHVFVKTLEFFVSQEGFRSSWGTKWEPVRAYSIEDARKKACKLFPHARPYEQQVK